MLYNVDVTLRLPMLVDAPDADAAAAAARARAVAAVPASCGITTVETTPLSLVEQLHADNLRAWQESEAVMRGTAEQHRRWLCGVLPEEELLELVRRELFLPFVAFARRQKISHTDISHLPFCARSLSGDLMQWSTEPNPELNAAEFRCLEQIRDCTARVMGHPWMALAASNSCAVEAREHKGTCTRCDRGSSQKSALVTVSWAGRRGLSREYLL